MFANSLLKSNFLRSFSKNKLYFPCNQYVFVKIEIFAEFAKNILPFLRLLL